MAHTPKQITELFAWVCRERDGGDGIPAIRGPDNMALPLVGSDRERMESLRGAAEQVASELGYPVRLMRFSAAEVLEEIPAKGGQC